MGTVGRDMGTVASVLAAAIVLGSSAQAAGDSTPRATMSVLGSSTQATGDASPRATTSFLGSNAQATGDATPQATTSFLGSNAQATGDASPRATASGSSGRTARAVTVDDVGHLRLLKAYGSVLIETGWADGTLPGRTDVRMTVGSTITATFSISTRYGAIYGNGRAALHSSGRYASFGGSLSVSHGSGRYAHARGAGRLYGVIERHTDALTVQTEGRLGY